MSCETIKVRLLDEHQNGNPELVFVVALRNTTSWAWDCIWMATMKIHPKECYHLCLKFKKTIIVVRYSRHEQLNQVCALVMDYSHQAKAGAKQKTSRNRFRKYRNNAVIPLIEGTKIEESFAFAFSFAQCEWPWGCAPLRSHTKRAQRWSDYRFCNFYNVCISDDQKKSGIIPLLWLHTFTQTCTWTSAPGRGLPLGLASLLWEFLDPPLNCMTKCG